MKNIRKTFEYTWIYYLLAIILSITINIYVFKIYHAPKDYETINIFIAETINDYSLETKAENSLDWLKDLNITSCNPEDSVFANKYNVVGLNSSDICLVSIDIANLTECSLTFATIDDNLGLDLFIQEDKAYGYYLNNNMKNKLSHYINLKDTDYVILINQNSINYENGNSILFVSWLIDYEL